MRFCRFPPGCRTARTAALGAGLAVLAVACPGPDRQSAGADAGDGGGDLSLGDAGAPDGGSGGDDLPPIDETPLAVGTRPAPFVLPLAYGHEQRWPVVMLLHGYMHWADGLDTYFGISALVDTLGFILVLPEGTVDADGNPFWNATDSCCDVYATGVDDLAYLTSLLDELEARFAVDPARVTVVGHSNGGFMAHRLACDAADRVSTIASVAGSTWLDPADCAPVRAVSMLQVHGTDDDVILYDGLESFYPSAPDTADRWATLDACGPFGAAELEPISIVGGDAPETDRASWSMCSEDTAVELWTMNGADHVPDFTSDFAPSLIEWLLSHPRP